MVTSAFAPNSLARPEFSHGTVRTPLVGPEERSISTNRPRAKNLERQFARVPIIGDGAEPAGIRPQ